MSHTIHGKTVGNIGFGLMGLTWRPSPATNEEAFAAIREAVSHNMTYLNGGEFYGPPTHNSLTLLKAYYEKYPEDKDKILLNIKGCITPSFTVDSSPAGVAESVARSVSQIGGKGLIDQFEPARKDPKVPIEETVAALQKEVENGNIRGISLSEVSASTIRRAAKVAKIESVEVELSLWQTEPLENGVLEACAELGIVVLAYSPLGRGMLTGQIKSWDDIPEGDYRRTLPRFQPEVFEKNMELVREVQKLAERKGLTAAQIAINWVLALSRRPGMPVIVPIPGASKPERVRENAVEVELSEEDMKEIEQVLKTFEVVGERYNEHGMEMLGNE
ncbi:putative pyridoxal reductase [Triangularia verruculosa]|uniref:Pyridoxal reductase n=1 Tax=Triangularia verruculosa TaxID=2587418 RepID=A0AAN6XVF1_9PEZI|nr:putative pyridoxal reductase [Triangularia verruculosa]